MKDYLNSIAIAACLSLSLASARSQGDPSNTREWLQQRKAEQTEAAGKTKVFHDFTFSDEVEASGITFQHHAVEDANKLYKAVHYDHGTGLAVADVDGDGLLDIYFVSQLGGNQLWRNLGNGRFENITAKAGVAVADRVGVAASFADIDNDGDPDLFVTTVRGGNLLFENLGGGKFRDITQQSGLGYVGHSSGAVFFDFDNDGLLDLFVVNVGNYTTDEKGVGGYYVGRTDAFKGHLHPERAEASILYKNMGHGVFKDVSRSMHLVDKGWSGDASFTDLNGDGFPDLYVLNMQGDDHYYENQGGKSFAEKTAAYFPKTSWGAMGIKFFDFNQDGKMDLFVTDMHSDMTGLQSKASRLNVRSDFETQKSEKMCTAEWTESFIQGSSNKIFGNSFYLNQGQGPLLEVSDKIGAETFWPWGFSAGDINADGYEDVFITAGMGFGFRYAINSLLLNENGNRFAPSEFVLGVEPRRNGRTQKTSFALDCSGADKDNPLCNGKTGRVPVSESLSSRSSVMLDLDNDGDLDIVTNEMNDRPQVLISNLAEKRKIHFLKVQLQGTKSNADGLGAVVKVFAGGKAWTQQHDGKSGYLGQSSMPLYFGLGEAAEATKLEINWPSGAKQVVTGPITANQLLKIKEPAK
ncbi:MAG: ypmQ 2 [Verrucomicrobiales bacterium]|nr:ypmQ 2 [Verrucomicrobiales bacterium]